MFVWVLHDLNPPNTSTGWWIRWFVACSSNGVVRNHRICRARAHTIRATVLGTCGVWLVHLVLLGVGVGCVDGYMSVNMGYIYRVYQWDM